jgi:hypothetical protein
MDGYGSHVTWDFFKYCIDNNIICLCLPPHSTYKLQLLDVVCFGPLQKRYSGKIDKRMKAGNFGIDKGTFLKYVNQLYFQYLFTNYLDLSLLQGNRPPKDW